MQAVKSCLDREAIVQAIRSCMPAGRKTFELHEPCFRGREWDYVKECLDTNWVSSVGKFVDRFETELANYTGVRFAAAIVNGTAALHIALKVAGVRSQDEVLVPALTFVATANAVAYCDAVPHFVDSDFKTLGVHPQKLENWLQTTAEIRGGECFNKTTGRRIKALIVMHTFGHPVDMDPIVELCSAFRLELIEDAAESLGSFYKGRHTGSWGKISALSFNGNKVITTGGGGAVLTNDLELGRHIKYLTTTAKVPHAWNFYHDQTGYNYRLPNLNAALGVAQLEQLPELLEKKRKLAMQYQSAFEKVAGLKFFEEPQQSKSNYWLNVVLLDPAFRGELTGLLKHLHEAGIKARPAWTLMHKLPMYQDCPRMDLSVAEDIESRLINLPSSASLVE
jgi:perosamine synthetase